MPQAYLNGIDVPDLFLWRTLAVKLLGSVGAVAGGLAVGKEGPFVHAGACLGALLSQVRGSARRTMHIQYVIDVLLVHVFRMHCTAPLNGGDGACWE
jgi:H+/Cl- antiporter ClcA